MAPLEMGLTARRRRWKGALIGMFGVSDRDGMERIPEFFRDRIGPDGMRP